MVLALHHKHIPLVHTPRNKNGRFGDIEADWTLRVGVGREISQDTLCECVLLYHHPIRVFFEPCRGEASNVVREGPNIFQNEAGMKDSATKSIA
jgi:hypothetical protein